MPEYRMKAGKGVIGEREEEEYGRYEEQEARETLSEAMQRAWQKPEMKPVKRKLKRIGEQIWGDQIKEAVKNTGYDKELEARAREVDLGKRIEKAWGKK